ncbi:hypothetical protein LC612_37005 [Nostoc sp. CHAB 5834]|nr:hypothetical protein [Nostoc sp. CHAB 5834]
MGSILDDDFEFTEFFAAVLWALVASAAWLTYELVMEVVSGVSREIPSWGLIGGQFLLTSALVAYAFVLSRRLAEVVGEQGVKKRRELLEELRGFSSLFFWVGFLMLLALAVCAASQPLETLTAVKTAVSALGFSGIGGWGLAFAAREVEDSVTESAHNRPFNEKAQQPKSLG